MKYLMVLPLIMSLAFSAPVEDVDKLVKRFAELNKASGVVLVAKGDVILYEEAFGLASREWEEPMASDIIFGIGSVSKTFTASLVMKMVAARKMNLEAPAIKVLPHLKAEWASEITLHHLLSHRSGLPHYPDDARETMFPLQWSKQDYLAKIEALPLDFKPGERFGYSSYGYYLLGLMLEEVSGLSYGELLKREILDPLGMQHTWLDEGQLIPKLAQPYHFDFETWSYRPSDARHFSTTYATGGLMTNAQDLLRWARACHKGELLPKEFHELRFEAHSQRYGYGFNRMTLEDFEGKQLQAFGHNGAVRGYTSNMLLIPDQDLTVIVLSNSRGYKDTGLPMQVVDVLLGKQVELKASLYKALVQAGVTGEETIAARYARLKKSVPDEYAFDDESQLFFATNILVRLKRYEHADEVLTLYDATFPDSGNRHYIRGERYRKQGDKVRAVQAYEACLTLMPEHRIAKKRLADLKNR